MLLQSIPWTTVNIRSRQQHQNPFGCHAILEKCICNNFPFRGRHVLNVLRNLKCMLYTLFRLHIASGSEKIKSIHMCLKNMYWLGQQCDSSGYRYTVCRKYLQYLLLYLHLTLPHQWQKQNHISSALIPFERSQSLEVRPWRLEVWQLQNIFGSRGF